MERARQRGFTLIEMAIVLTIIAIAAGYGLKIASALQARATYENTKTRAAVIQQALIAFVMRNGRLPCPAVMTPASPSEAGLENCQAGNLTPDKSFFYGPVPYASLGIPQSDSLDGWNVQFDLAVSAYATNTPAAYPAAPPATPLDARRCYGYPPSAPLSAPPKPIPYCAQTLIDQSNSPPEISGDAYWQFAWGKSFTVMENGTARAVVLALVSHGENRGGGVDYAGNPQAFATPATAVDTSNSLGATRVRTDPIVVPPIGGDETDLVWFATYDNVVARAQMAPLPYLHTVNLPAPAPPAGP